MDVSGIRQALAVFPLDRASLSLNARLVGFQNVKLHLTENTIFLNLRHNHEQLPHGSPTNYIIGNHDKPKTMARVL